MAIYHVKDANNISKSNREGMRKMSNAQVAYLAKLQNISLSLKSWAKARFEEGWDISDIQVVLIKAAKA